MNRAFHKKQVKLKNNEGRLWDSALRNNRRRCSIKKSVKKHLWWSLFLIKLQSWRSATLFKRDSNTPTQMLSCKYCEIFKNTFFENHWRTAGSEYLVSVLCHLFWKKKKILTIEKITLSIDPSHRLMSIECVIYPTDTRTFWSESDSRPSKCTES